MEQRIDLHVHSTASDGTCSPTELIHLAKKAGLRAMALTDHDTTAGIPEALTAAAPADIELIPGVELSCSYQGKEIHIVGLFLDHTDPHLNQVLSEFRDNRDNRNVQMIQRLQDAGFSLTLEQLQERFQDSVLTRAHIARYLVDTKQVKDLDTMFNRYIGDTCPCYVPRQKISPFEAVSLIRAAHGVAILAHPLLYHLQPAELETLVSDLSDCGLTGLEALYSTHFGKDTENMKQLAARHGLLISGGSDFHGDNKPYIHLGTGKGQLFIPYSVLEALKDRRP